MESEYQCVIDIHFVGGDIQFGVSSDTQKYLKAVDRGFKKYLKQLEKEGILPLKTQEFAHPLGDDVLNAFYDFSSILNS